MREILPGIFHWTAVHPNIQMEVSSYYVREARALLDPLLPAEGLAWFREHGAPEHAILTNRHHYRDCAKLEEAFGCTVWCNEEGMHEFSRGEKVRPFRAGEVLPGAIESHAVGVLCPDETALRIPIAEGVLAVADGVIRLDDGPLQFVPDPLLGDDPEAIRAGLKDAYSRLLDLDFDHILFAHGAPWVGGAKKALRDFVAS